jgi:hypothetical protein
MSLHYYAQRKSIQNGEPKADVNKYGDRAQMERQYHLFCASAATNTDGFDADSIEWGTIEQGIIERKFWQRETVTPEVSEPAEGE